MKKECPKIVQKLSTHTEIIQKSSSSIQKIYNNCAKNCNASINKLLQFLAQLLYIFCMELDDFWMISVCVDNFWMIFGHFLSQGLYSISNKIMFTYFTSNTLLYQGCVTFITAASPRIDYPFPSICDGLGRTIVVSMKDAFLSEFFHKRNFIQSRDYDHKMPFNPIYTQI